MRDNELKYREELFKLLKESFGNIDEVELKLLEDLILSDNINNEELLNRIKRL